MFSLGFNKKTDTKDDLIPLEEVTADTPFFSLNGYSTLAKVVKVYDGDTIQVVFKYFDKYYKWRCRISHVDTPEIKTPNQKEKEMAILVRDKVSSMILNKVVQIECFEFDKYGRLLIEIVLPNSTTKLHDWLIGNVYAYKYEGGTKHAW